MSPLQEGPAQRPELTRSHLPSAAGSSARGPLCLGLATLVTCAWLPHLPDIFSRFRPRGPPHRSLKIRSPSTPTPPSLLAPRTYSWLRHTYHADRASNVLTRVRCLAPLMGMRDHKSRTLPTEVARQPQHPEQPGPW